MSYTTLLKEHVATSLKTNSSANQGYEPYILVMPEYLIQSQKQYTEKLFQLVCEAITSNKYIVLDFQNTRSIDVYNSKILSELFQTAYNFTVGLSFINLSPQIDCIYSITGYSPLAMI